MGSLKRTIPPHKAKTCKGLLAHPAPKASSHSHSPPSRPSQLAHPPLEAMHPAAQAPVGHLPWAWGPWAAAQTLPPGKEVHLQGPWYCLPWGLLDWISVYLKHSPHLIHLTPVLHKKNVRKKLEPPNIFLAPSLHSFSSLLLTADSNTGQAGYLIPT